jgi:hypothetical protein
MPITAPTNRTTNVYFANSQRDGSASDLLHDEFQAALSRTPLVVGRRVGGMKI